MAVSVGLLFARQLVREPFGFEVVELPALLDLKRGAGAAASSAARTEVPWPNSPKAAAEIWKSVDISGEISQFQINRQILD